ncbi:hypothetical protein H4R34_004017 [Dimargaris verticillata]|uniref:Serine aminopeptidase S33 domain-containing protein n=1 Tax=Dimargaris verticillata TaxID=2761393 RepID=A0A9W8AZR9_9FUNG|nr:hypothetical protein H4R34_004017 [Dimargaris verticillata]
MLPSGRRYSLTASSSYPESLTLSSGASVSSFEASETEEWITTSDGYQLYTRVYRPVHRDPCAILVLVHGFGEHSDRYAPLCRRFTHVGVQVYTYDQRGYGKTGLRSKRPGHTYGFDTLTNDLSFICSRAYNANIPTVIFGHALGAVVALSYLTSPLHRLPVAGLICQASAMLTNTDLHPPKLAVSLGHLAAKVLKTLTISANVLPEYLTRDKRVVADFISSKYNYEIGSLQCLSDLLRRGSMLLDRKSLQLDCPVLITHGDNDLITPHAGSIQLFEKLPYDMDKELKIYRGCYHERK